MASLDDIDFEKSLSRHKLVLKTKWLDTIDSFGFFLAGALFLGSIILTYRKADLTNPNDREIAYIVLPITGLFAIVLLYRKATEKRLLTIATRLNKSDTRQLIKKAFVSWGWNIRRDNANYLQATTGFNVRWGKQITILFDKDSIYLNVMSDNPMIRMPVLFTDKLVKHDIKKLLEASTQQQVWQ